MKKLITIAMVLTMLIACKKTTKTPYQYKAVSESSVPAPVASSLKAKHPDATSRKWLIKKDNSAYVAVFPNTTGAKTMTTIDNLGNIIKENELNQDQEGELENETEGDDD